jgi:Transposase DDE domain
MKPPLLPVENLPDVFARNTTTVPVCVANQVQFACDALDRLPLAESVLLLWQQVADPKFLDDLFNRHRGRGYDKVLTFPSLVQLIADALLQHDGSARASFERALEHDALPVTIPAAYGKLRRLPIAVSTAFLAEGTARLQDLLPGRPTSTVPSSTIPASLQSFRVMVLDGKTIKHVAKRLKLLRGVRSGLVGGKTLVAMELNSGLAVAMRAHADGEINELRLVPDLVAEVEQRVPGPRLWVGDRLYCDLEQTGRFLAAGDHFLIRYQNKVHFHPDPKRSVRHGSDEGGRPYTEEWGWLGAETDPRRRYVRRITLTRPTDEALVLVTDLVDAARYPAVDLLAMYQARWGIENVFQQVTEVFPLKRLIGGTPQAGVFQMAFCLLLYNMIHVMRAHVAAAQQWEPADVSLEKLFEDVEKELIAWTVMVAPIDTVTVFGKIPSVAQVRKRLSKLLGTVWQDRWLKTVNEKLRPHRRKAQTCRGHTSIHRVLEDHRRQHSRAQQMLNQ